MYAQMTWDNTDPEKAVATFGFFGIGKILHWLGDAGNLSEVNTFLSTISFLISITIGVTTLVRLYKRWKKS